MLRRLALTVSVALVTMFGGAAWLWPPALCLLPAVWLRASRDARNRGDLFGIYLGACVGTWFGWHGAVPLPAAAFIAFCLVASAFAMLPLLLDRGPGARLSPLPRALLFVCSWVGIEQIRVTFSPFASWGSSGYALAGWPTLAQPAAVGGVVLLGGLLAAAAALANGILDMRASPAARRPLLLIATALASLWLAAAWASPAPESTGQLRLAAIEVDHGSWDGYLDPARRDVARLAAESQSQQEQLFAADREAARAGADLIVWSELSVPVTADARDATLSRMSAHARELDRVLVATVAVLEADRRAYQNVAWVFERDGQLLHEYHKARPVPGDPEVGAGSEWAVIDTSVGRIGLGICYDADFPLLAREAANRGAQLLLVPAWDWAQISPLHGQMASLRAVETGLPLLRSTHHGLAIASGADGRPVATAITTGPGASIMLADLPLASRVTPYRRFGDWFGWSATAMLLPLVVIGGRRRRVPVNAGGGT